MALPLGWGEVFWDEVDEPLELFVEVEEDELPAVDGTELGGVAGRAESVSDMS